MGGLWSKKAMEEVRKHGKVHVAHDTRDNGCRYYAPVKEWYVYWCCLSLLPFRSVSSAFTASVMKLHLSRYSVSALSCF